ncbi:NAD(P)/FAD-dependent oxidoreductase [Kitasatospora cinereorecta]|uniref:NAD(P)/FAD-dependent oxidoreductase n=1 Tax=Kitasatospora cinereorecta TaxID=285560 RepID=UPI0031F91476
MNDRVLVVGHGPAAHRLVHRLRALGHTGPLTVLGRPGTHHGLATAVLTGALPPDAADLPAHPAGTAEVHPVQAVRIDRARHAVHADDGTVHRYDTLVLATGARPRRPGPHLGGDVRALRAPARSAVGDGPVAVLGSGPYAVEAALALRRTGRDTVLVHPGDRLLDGLLDPGAADLLAVRLAAAGVDLRPGRTAVEHLPGTLVLDDGEALPADTLLLDTGLRPTTGLARAAGLAVHRAVTVDALLRTSDPAVHALGDCADAPGDGWEQAEALARLLTGATPRLRPGPVTRLPAADTLAIGTPGDGDQQLTLRDPARGRYAALGLRGERIVSASIVGLPRAVAAVTQLHDRDLPVPADRLALLLGTPAALPGAAEPGPDTVVCHCATVTRRTLATAWHAGACDPAALTAATRAGSGCGGCAGELRALCQAFAREEAAAPGTGAVPAAPTRPRTEQPV